MERTKLSVIGVVRSTHPEEAFRPMIIAAVNYVMSGPIPKGSTVAQLAEQTTAVLKGSIDMLKAVRAGEMDKMVFVNNQRAVM